MLAGPRHTHNARGAKQQGEARSARLVAPVKTEIMPARPARRPRHKEPMPPTVIRVVAAVVEDAGLYLITQRREEAVLAGLWEFPGGKVEAGESDEQALARELRERIRV